MRRRSVTSTMLDGTEPCQQRLTGGRGLVNKILLTLVLGASLAQAAPVQPVTVDPGKQVLETEHARTTALERIMADDVTYIHASGKVDTKKSYLDAIRSGQLHYISWRPRSLHVRVLGNCAVIDGEYAVRVTDSRVQPAP